MFDIYQMAEQQLINAIDGVVCDNLYDPVTHEPFTHPIVLTCGHTVNKTSLGADNLCPICRRETLQTQVVNWVVVGLLNLNIRRDADEYGIKPARQVLEIKRLAHEKKLNETVKVFMAIIEEAVKNDKDSAMMIVDDRDIRLKMVTLFRNKGYDAKESGYEGNAWTIYVRLTPI